MEVVLKPLKGFTVETMDGRNLGTFVRTSEWNGMTQLKQGNEVLIVETGSGFDAILDGLFGGEKPKAVPVVKASPDLIVRMNQAHFDRT